MIGTTRSCVDLWERFPETQHAQFGGKVSGSELQCVSVKHYEVSWLLDLGPLTKYGCRFTAPDCKKSKSSAGLLG